MSTHRIFVRQDDGKFRDTPWYSMVLYNKGEMIGKINVIIDAPFRTSIKAVRYRDLDLNEPVPDEVQAVVSDE